LCSADRSECVLISAGLIFRDDFARVGGINVLKGEAGDGRNPITADKVQIFSHGENFIRLWAICHRKKNLLKTKANTSPDTYIARKQASVTNARDLRVANRWYGTRMASAKNTKLSKS